MADIKINVGVVGGTGYTGVELLRLLAAHPNVNLQAITSRSESGTAVADMFPSLRGHVPLNFTTPDESDLSQCDLVFFATPNGIAMQSTPELLDKGVRVIDLAAGKCNVLGKGGVTVLREGKEYRFGHKVAFSAGELGAFHPPRPLS